MEWGNIPTTIIARYKQEFNTYFTAQQNTKTKPGPWKFMMFLSDVSNSEELANFTCNISPNPTDTIGLLLNLEEEIK